jgi:hypothetical protein
MALKVARRGSIPPFIVMDVMRAANEREAAGQDVLHMATTASAIPTLSAYRPCGSGSRATIRRSMASSWRATGWR